METWHSIGTEFKCKQYLIDHPEVKHIWTDKMIPSGYDVKYWHEDEVLHLEPFDIGKVVKSNQEPISITWGRAHVKRLSKRFKKRICCVCSHVMKIDRFGIGEIFIERTEHNGGFEHYSHAFCFHHGFQHICRQPVTYQYKNKKVK